METRNQSQQRKLFRFFTGFHVLKPTSLSLSRMKCKQGLGRGGRISVSDRFANGEPIRFADSVRLGIHSDTEILDYGLPAEHSFEVRVARHFGSHSIALKF